MKIERIRLKNFRNIEECSFAPNRHLNFLVGLNAQGKTSVLESLSYLSTLRSFRSAKSHEVVRWGADQAEVTCDLSRLDDENGDWRSELSISFAIQSEDRQRASKSASINQKPYRSSTQYLGQRFQPAGAGFHSIVFNPADHELVRGEPKLRRSFLNQVVAAEDLDYLKSLKRYQRLLEQKNALLKEARHRGRRPDLLEGFNIQMSQEAGHIVFKRLEWLKNLTDNIDQVRQKIAPNQSRLGVFYASEWLSEIPGFQKKFSKLSELHFAGLCDLPSLEDLSRAFLDRSSSLQDAEWHSGRSLVGPHRDDWMLTLGDQVLKGHGSQGEVRTALLALKLSEIDLFLRKTGSRPILLLDDFSSELDRERRSFLMSYLLETDLQVFVTTTETPSFPEVDLKSFEVQSGNVISNEAK